jgi:hypothetical protein
MTDEKENVYSATLMILGNDLDPDLVSRSLGLNPDKAWRKGERKFFKKDDGTTRYFDSYYQGGGWKCFTNKNWLCQSLEEELEAWSEILSAREQAIIDLQGLGYNFTLDCCVVSTGSEVIRLWPELQRALGNLNVEIDITFYTHQEVSQDEV